MRAGAADRWFPIAVFGAALSLRAIGIGFGLPAVYHQDEPILMNHALAAAANGGHPLFFVIPGLSLYLTMAGLGVYYLAASAAGAVSGREGFLDLYLADPTVFMLIGRWITGVIPGTLTAVAAAIAASRLWGRKAALTAGLALAAAPLAVQHSHYLYADTLTAFFLTLYLGACLLLSEKGAPKYVWTAGIAMGLATASKYNAAFYLPAGIAAIWTGIREGKGRIAALLCAAGTAAAAFFVASPFTLLDLSNALPQILRQSGATVAPGWSHHWTHSLSNGTHPLFLAAAAAGLLALVLRRRPAGTVLLIYLLSGAASLAGFSQHFGRYALPLVPALAFAAGACWTAGPLSRRPRLTAVFLTAAIGVMLVPTCRYLRLLSVPDTRTLCREWVLNHVPSGSGIARDHTFFAPPLDQDPEEVLKAAPEGDEMRTVKAARLAEIHRARKTYRIYTLRASEGGMEPVFMGQRPWLRPDLASLSNADVRTVIFNGSDTLPEYEALRRALRTASPPAAVFSPFKDPARRTSSDLFESTAAPLERSALEERERLGPYLEVYRIEGPGEPAS